MEERNNVEVAMERGGGSVRYCRGVTSLWRMTCQTSFRLSWPDVPCLIIFMFTLRFARLIVPIRHLVVNFAVSQSFSPACPLCWG